LCKWQEKRIAISVHNNTTETEKPKKKREIDDKISIFGILGASKAITKPVNLMLELQKEQLEVAKNIEKQLEKSSKAQEEIAKYLLRTAQTLENRQGKAG
jgi:hypothetical protein